MCPLKCPGISVRTSIDTSRIFSVCCRLLAADSEAFERRGIWTAEVPGQDPVVLTVPLLLTIKGGYKCMQMQEYGCRDRFRLLILNQYSYDCPDESDDVLTDNCNLASVLRLEKLKNLLLTWSNVPEVDWGVVDSAKNLRKHYDEIPRHINESDSLRL